MVLPLVPDDMMLWCCLALWRTHSGVGVVPVLRGGLVWCWVWVGASVVNQPRAGKWCGPLPPNSTPDNCISSPAASICTSFLASAPADRKNALLTPVERGCSRLQKQPRVTGAIVWTCNRRSSSDPTGGGGMMSSVLHRCAPDQRRPPPPQFTPLEGRAGTTPHTHHTNTAGHHPHSSTCCARSLQPWPPTSAPPHRIPPAPPQHNQGSVATSRR